MYIFVHKLDKKQITLKTERIHTLKNDQLTVVVNSKGAELTSIKTDTLEYMWQATAPFWGKHAPILFPIIGRLVDHEYTYKGKTYQMGQHGFVRNEEFELVAETANSITLKQKATDKSKNIFPFDFSLYVKYTLSGQHLTTEYKVENPSNSEDLYFSIGAHPAFACPFEEGQKRSDYQLVFDKEVAPQALLHVGGLYEGDLCSALSPKGVMDISDTLFDKGSLTFSPNPFSKVTFEHKPSKKAYLSVVFENYPFLGIWSQNSASPFVCIEPWHGIADKKGHNKDFIQKEGVKKLLPKETFSCSFIIEIH